jgi:bacteriorhodopsin
MGGITTPIPRTKIKIDPPWSEGIWILLCFFFFFFFVIRYSVAEVMLLLFLCMVTSQTVTGYTTVTSGYTATVVEYAPVSANVSENLELYKSFVGQAAEQDVSKQQNNIMT